MGVARKVLGSLQRAPLKGISASWLELLMGVPRKVLGSVQRAPLKGIATWLEPRI